MNSIIDAAGNYKTAISRGLLRKKSERVSKKLLPKIQTDIIIKLTGKANKLQLVRGLEEEFTSRNSCSLSLHNFGPFKRLR
jgi:hypothetical protein